MTAAVSKFTEGSVFRLDQVGAAEGLSSVVDYRGDVALHLKSGEVLEGFVFNCTEVTIDFYKRDELAPQSLLLTEVESITFSGKDTAKGKSFDDWQSKKAAEKALIKASPVE